MENKELAPKQEITVVNKEFYSKIKNDWIMQSNLSESDFLREVSFAIQHMHKSPYLQKADPASVLKAVMNLAQVGLTLNPVSKFAALVPRYNSQTRSVDCVLEPMYQGLTKLLTDSGAVKSLDAHVVFDGDEFIFDYANPEKIVRHVPYFLSGKSKGNIKAVYSKAVLIDNSIHAEIMAYADVCEIRDRSESYKAFKEGKTKSCIWVSDEPEMCRKTVIKRHYKYLPKSKELEKLEKAIDLDNQANGFDELIDFGLLSWIESMIGQSMIDAPQKEKFMNRLAKLEYKSQGFKMIDELKEYQPIMGMHSIPQDVKQQGEAIRFQVDKDDYNESRKK